MRFSVTGGRVAVVLAATAALGLVEACGNDAKKPAGVTPSTGGSGGRGGGTGKGGTAGRSSSGGNAGKSAGGTSSNPEGGEAGVLAGGGESATGGASGGSAGASGKAATGGKGGSAGAGAGAGSAGSAGVGGFPPDPTFECPPEPTSGTPPSSSPVCDVETMWGTGERVSVPTTGNDVLHSITPDERSIVWVAVDVFYSTAYVADRASAASDFDAPVELTDPVLLGASQLTLSPDGLRLAAAVSGRLLEATRAARGDGFDAPVEGSFATLNTDAQDQGLFLADPVISADDLTLYYSASGDGDDTLRISTRSGTGAWPVGRGLDECEFKSHPQGGRAPRGISSDGLTLFYFDNPRGIMRAAFRPALDWPFLEFVDLEDRFVARPNAMCDRLYYTGEGVFPTELLFAEPE